MFFLLLIPNLYANSACDSRWSKLFPQSIEARYKSLVGKCDSELKAALADIISTNTNANYALARMNMYSIDRTPEGKLCSVYTEECISYSSGNPVDFNCEHSWPQSKGATGIAKADIHHLYPVDTKTNTLRANYPFCVISDAAPATEFESAMGENEDHQPCFDPKGEHKGELARSMFYFSVRYGKPIDPKQEAFFRDWNDRAVSETEKTRNDKIEAFQHNRNPFVDHPEFVELISDF